MDNYPPSPLCTPVRFLRVSRGRELVETFFLTLGGEGIPKGGFVIALNLADLFPVLPGDVGDEILNYRADIVLPCGWDDLRD